MSAHPPWSIRGCESLPAFASHAAVNRDIMANPGPAAHNGPPGHDRPSGVYADPSPAFSRPFLLQEALPYSPFTSIIPFDSSGPPLRSFRDAPSFPLVGNGKILWLTIYISQACSQRHQLALPHQRQPSATSFQAKSSIRSTRMLGAPRHYPSVCSIP